LCLADKQSGKALPTLDRVLYVDDQRYIVIPAPAPSAEPQILHEIEIPCDANGPRPRRLFGNASPDARRRLLFELADLERANKAKRFVAHLRYDGRLFAAYARPSGGGDHAVLDRAGASTAVDAQKAAHTGAAATAADAIVHAEVPAAVSGAKLAFAPPPQLNEYIYVSRSPRPGEDGGWAEELVAWVASNHGKNLCVFDVGCEVAYSPALFEYRVQRHPPPADAEEGCILFSDVADFCRRLETWLKVAAPRCRAHGYLPARSVVFVRAYPCTWDVGAVGSRERVEVAADGPTGVRRRRTLSTSHLSIAPTVCGGPG
jgi:hypothetical protein